MKNFDQLSIRIRPTFDNFRPANESDRAFVFHERPGTDRRRTETGYRTRRLRVGSPESARRAVYGRNFGVRPYRKLDENFRPTFDKTERARRDR